MHLHALPLESNREGPSESQAFLCFILSMCLPQCLYTYSGSVYMFRYHVSGANVDEWFYHGAGTEEQPAGDDGPTPEAGPKGRPTAGGAALEGAEGGAMGEAPPEGVPEQGVSCLACVAWEFEVLLSLAAVVETG